MPGREAVEEEEVGLFGAIFGGGAEAPAPVAAEAPAEEEGAGGTWAAMFGLEGDDTEDACTHSHLVEQVWYP